MRAVRGEALGLIISFLGIGGLLVGLFGLPWLLSTAWGYIVFGGAAIGGLLYLFATLRQGKNILLALTALVLTSGLAFGSSFGIMWYFMTYLPANGGLGLELMFETPLNSSDSFATNLKRGDFEKAYEILSPDAQKQIPDVDTFRRIVTENHWQPTKWKWTIKNSDLEHAEYVGEASFTGNKTGLIQLWLDRIDKHWMVSSMDFKTQ